jgi:thiosulfate dehydrogenase (quinone) large subunit
MKAIKPYLDVTLAAVITIGFVLFQWGAKNVALNEGAGLFLVGLGVVVVIGALATLIYDKLVTNRLDAAQTEVQQPAIARLLFHDTRSAPLWLAVRFYLGFQWLEAGYHKFTGTGWMDGGSALKGYWTKAIAVDPKTGTGAISNDYGWYRDFLTYTLNHEWYTWFAKLIVTGEILVGIGIIVGGLVGIAAFFGALMNMSFMLAGSASTNPVLFTLAILLMMSWQVAGYWGVDRFVLPLIGAPWTPGRLFRRTSRQPAPAPVA